jgi:CRP-like cAMP-binding protein
VSSHLMIERLQSTAALLDSDRAVLVSLPSTTRSFANGDFIARDGERSLQSAVILSGFLYRQKTARARSQILSFYVPGDMPDIQTLHLPLMDHDLVSAGAATVAFIPNNVLIRVLDQSRSLTHIFWRETLIDAAIFREWVTNIGSRDALSRVAHVICELCNRLGTVGLVRDGTFSIPFTQQQMADACGLSVVHINRTIQELRHRQLISWESRTVAILNRSELDEVADFDPAYLHRDV